MAEEVVLSEGELIVGSTGQRVSTANLTNSGTFVPWFNVAGGNGAADDRAALVAADVAAAASVGWVRLTGTHLIASNVTVASTIIAPPGTMLKPANGVTITLTDLTDTGTHQIFDLSLGGTVNIAGSSPVVRPEWWGAKANWQQVTDGSLTAGTLVLNSVSGLFATTDVGKQIGVAGVFAGQTAAQSTWTTTIASWTSASQVVLTDATAWSPLTTYALGAVVSSGGIRYVSLAAANLNNPPASSPSQWAPQVTATGATVQWWTDDRAAFKACMAALQYATQPLVDLRGVTYIVGQESSSAWSLKVPYSGIRFRGIRGRTWLKHPTGLSRAGGTDILQIVSVDDVEVDGVGFDGNWGNDGTVDSVTGINHVSQTDPKNACVRIRDCDGTVLQNCKMRQAYGDFVWTGALNANTLADSLASAPTNIRLAWCDGDMAARDGVVVGAPVDGLYLEHCNWTNIYTQSLDTEPVGNFGYARNVHAYGCTFGGWWNPGNVARTANNVVTIIGGQGTAAAETNYARGYRLRDCTVYGGVSIYSARDIVLDNCRIVCNWTGAGSSPVYVDHWCDDIWVKDCVVYDRVSPGAPPGSLVPAGSNLSNHDASIQIVRNSDSTPLLPQGVRVTGCRVKSRNSRIGIAVIGTGGSVGDAGTASATSATTLTDSGKTWTSNQWINHTVVCGGVQGQVSGNTTTVLTVVAWTDAFGAAASTPAAGVYSINGLSGMVDIDANHVDLTDDGNGAGGEGIFVYPAQGHTRVRIRNNTIVNPTGPGIDIKPLDANRPIAYLAILDNHVLDDRPTPAATAVINFRQANLNFVTQLLMRGNTAGVGVPALVTGLTAGTWRTGGASAPTYEGFGSPEGVVTAPIGSRYADLTGTTNTTTYRKESGTGNTGWVADSALPASGTQHSFAITANDQNVGPSNIVMADVTGLSFAIAANEVWVYEAVIFYDSATAADMRVQFVAPASPTLHKQGVVALATSATSATGSLSDVASSGTNAMTIGGAGVGSRLMVAFKGIIENGANAGTVKVQAAQGTSDATATTVQAGSYITAHRQSP